MGFAFSRVALLALALVSVSAVARADEPPDGPADAAVTDDGQARARALFVEGRDRVQRGDIDGGCEKLRESHALSPDAVGPLLNVADCDERAGRLATAWSRFRRAAALAPVGDRRRDYAKQRAASVAPRIPRLVVALPPSAPAGTRVTQDGKPLVAAELGASRQLDPGSYRFEVTAPGRPPRVTEIVLAAGVTEARVLAFDGMPGATPAAPAVDHGPSTELVAGLTLSGAGALLVAAGIVTGIIVGVQAGRYEDHCQDGICDDDGLDAASLGNKLSVISPVCLAVGAASLGIGVPLWLSSPEASPPRPGTETALAAAPVGLHVKGAFW